MKGRRSAVVAQKRELDGCGARASKDGERDVFEIRGWKFTSFHTNIIDSSESSVLQDSIYDRLSLAGPAGEGGSAAAPNSGPNLRIPPMIFGHDIMRIEKMVDVGAAAETVFDDAAFQLSLDAEDALTLWAAQHTPENLAKHPLNVIQVPYAAIWSKLNGPASALSTAALSEAKAISPDRKKQQEDKAGAGSGSPIQIDRRSPIWDWTFSSDYCCTLGKRQKSRQHIVGFRELFSPLRSEEDSLVASVQVAPTSGIEYDLLKANDVPILFYDEILLYQDDLEDCGEVVFEAKLRVMPHCWFLLSRMFLRVDGVMLRIRDNRFFHRFGTDSVHLEVSWKESKLALKVDNGGGDGGDSPSTPAAAPGYLHVDGSSMRDINKLASIVPVVANKNLTLKC